MRPPLLLCLATLGLSPAVAAPGPAPRADFLRLIDRPRVALDATASAPAREDALVRIDFSYQTEAGQRVPGILIEPAMAAGRRPAVIALHGTGGRKENELPLLRELAHLGFVAVATCCSQQGQA